MAYATDPNKIPLRGKGAKLTPKMQLFCSEYVKDFNGADAVVRAGYASKCPRKHAAQLLNHPTIQRKVQRFIDEKQKRNAISADYVIQKLQSIVEATEADNPQHALRGLELIGRHLKLFTDRQEISGPDGEAIKMEQKVNEDISDFRSKLTSLSKRGGATEVTEFPKPASSGKA